MRHFCTYFNVDYMQRGLALHSSLMEHSASFTLWILCLDQATFEFLSALNLPNVSLVTMDAFEKGDTALVKAKSDRSRVEYYWTCTPSLPLFLFREHPEIASICYVDADYYFFSNPEAIFKALGQGSIFVIPHDYDTRIYGSTPTAGNYNVGILVFRNDGNSRDCLNVWRNQCISWCKKAHDGSKFGDQGYLDQWPENFQGVVVSCNPGIHAGPWNIGKYIFGKSANTVYVSGEELVCYHFHGLRLLADRVCLVYEGRTFMTRDIRKHIYGPYFKALKQFGSNGQIMRCAARTSPSRSDLLFIAKRVLTNTWYSTVLV